MRFKSAKKLIDFLSIQKKKISPLLILTHDFPDPDALAAAYGLQYLAKHSFEIQSRIVYRGIIGRIENRNMVKLLNLPAYPLKPLEIQKHQHIALVDTQPGFENNPFPMERKATLVIDQHPSVTKKKPEGDFVLVDERCGATCVILAEALLLLNLKIPKRLATALAYGIITDTLKLYRAKRQDIIQTYLKILSFADMRDLAQIQIPIYEKEYFSILGKGIRSARLSQGLLICHLGRVSSPDVVSQMADFLLSFEKTKWSFITGRFRNRLHVSLRAAKMDFHTAKVLRKCFENPKDAGGHGSIAGGSLKISPKSERKFKKEEKKLESQISKRLHLAKNKRFTYPFK